MASGLAQSGVCRELIHLRSELHTNSVQVRASAGPKIFWNAVEVRSVGMYVVWLSPTGCGGFTGIIREAEMCSGFPPPKVALVTVTSGEKGLWVVWCNSGEVRVKEQGREIHIDRIQICVRIINVWWLALILSQWRVVGCPYMWVNTRCANDGRISTYIPIPMAVIQGILWVLIG